MNRTCNWLVIAFAICQLACGYRVIVPAGEKLCFFENLTKQQKMGINFQVEEGGNYDIDLTVSTHPHQTICSLTRFVV